MIERLQKIISSAGLMSRRAAEKCIADGRVTLNGVVAEIGMSAEAGIDDIRIDGIPIPLNGEKVYIMLNKPAGYLTTVSDDRGRKTVMELTHSVGARIYPVGRLDIDSEGLLLFMNDGEVAKKLLHPSHNVLKTYRVRVRGDLERALPVLRGDIEIEGRVIRAKSVSLTQIGDGDGSMDITIGEGRNRQVRRMCTYAGLRVARLVRISEGDLSLGDLKSGKWRYLTEREINYLRELQ